MTWARRPIAAAVVVIGVTACGSSGPSTGGLPVAGPVTDAGQSLPTLDSAGFDAGRPDGPDALPVSHEHRNGCLLSEPWTAIGISRDGRKLLVHTGGDEGLLMRYAGSAVRESSSRVEVGTYLIKLKHGDGSGVSAVSFLPVVVQLTEPLGKRALVHAAVTAQC